MIDIEPEDIATLRSCDLDNIPDGIIVSNTEIILATLSKVMLQIIFNTEQEEDYQREQREGRG